MKKDFGAQPYLFPMPVLMVATYGKDGKADVMNMAWGGICAHDFVTMSIAKERKTAQNIRERQAFTVSVADIPHLAEADFFGIASGNKMEDKFERSGLHASKSTRVDAPVIEEFPLTLECRAVEFRDDPRLGYQIIGEIVNVLADETVLDEGGKINPARLNAFAFDQMRHGYYRIGEKVGQAFHDGAGLMKKG